MCDVDTILVVRDKRNKRITLYESSPEEFSIEEAKQLLDSIKFQESEEALKWTKISYTNENYLNIKEESNNTPVEMPVVEQLDDSNSTHSTYATTQITN